MYRKVYTIRVPANLRKICLANPFTVVRLDFTFPVPHQVNELGDGDLSDGLLHAAQSLQRGTKATRQVVARDGDEVVFATVQVEHQNVLYGVLSGVQQRDGVFTDVHLQIDLQRLICTGRQERGSTYNTTRLSSENIAGGFQERCTNPL